MADQHLKKISFDAIDPVVKYINVQAGNRSDDFKPKASNTKWTLVWDAKVKKIVHNDGPKPSYATIELQGRRWNDSLGFGFGDCIRIETAEEDILFQGFVTNLRAHFNGGSTGQKATESIMVTVAGTRWLVDRCCPVYGQFARSYDDYEDIASEDRTGIPNGYRHFTGRRCIFNRDGLPDKDPLELDLALYGSGSIFQPIYSEFVPVFGRRYNGLYWSARDMIVYLISPFHMMPVDFYYFETPDLLDGVKDWKFNTAVPGTDEAKELEDFGSILFDVNVDGLSVFEAVEYICRQIGWGFKINQHQQLSFYKHLSASGLSRGRTGDVILHNLWAPDVDEDIDEAVKAGKKMVHWSTLEGDITEVANAPIVGGAPRKVEFTLDLVPGWKDADLVVPASDPMLTEADLADQTDPDSFDFFKYYHSSGSNFKRAVGRLWVLNENGRYSESDYDRGEPFDWSAVLPEELALDEDNKTTYGLFEKKLLPAITADSDSGDSVRYKVEFTFDGGDTWQQIPCAIHALEEQAGIWLAEPNLAEITDNFNEVVADGSVFDGEVYNYWISLALDKIFQDDNPDLTWKAGSWLTRVRITACVQLDDRLIAERDPSGRSGSPLLHKRYFDMSGKYHYDRQLETSGFYGLEGYTAMERDHRGDIARHAESIQLLTEDRSLAGSIALDRLWLVDVTVENYFEVGDGIAQMLGRNVRLNSSIGTRKIYPEIVQVVHDFEMQQTILNTRDLRWSQERAL